MRPPKFRSLKLELPSKNWMVFLFFWLAIVAYLVFGKLIPTIRMNIQLRKLLEKKEEILVKYHQKLETEKKELEKLKKTEVATQEKDKIFSAQDPYALVSEIQSLMDNLPSLKVKTFRITSTREVSEEIKLITVQFALEADIEALVELLKRFSSQAQSVRLKRLDIYSFKKSQGWLLNINLDVEAILYSEESDSFNLTVK